MEKMLNSEIIQYIAALLTISAVLIKTVETIMCIYLMEESENIGASKCKFIKQMKLKFENSCKLNSDMRNVEAFVKKNLEKYRFLNISMRGMTVLANTIKMLLLIGGLVEFAFKYYAGKPFAESIIYVEYAIGGILMIVLAEVILDSQYKRLVAINNFVEYFDNTLMDRMRYERSILEEEELARDTVKKSSAMENSSQYNNENMMDKPKDGEEILSKKVNQELENEITGININDSDFVYNKLKEETTMANQSGQDSGKSIKKKKNRDDNNLTENGKYDEEVIEDILNQFLA